jgi:hypothetical protein
MEPESSFLCSQELATGSYPEPDQSCPYSHTPFLLRSILILSAHLHPLMSSEWFFPSDILIQFLYAFLVFSMRATCSANVILLHLITLVISEEEYK